MKFKEYIDKYNKNKKMIKNALSVYYKSTPTLVKLIPFHIIVIAIIYLFKASVPLLQVVLTQKLINVVQEVINHQNRNGIVYEILAIQLLLQIFNVMLKAFEDQIVIRAQHKISFFFEKAVIQKTLKLPLPFFEDFESIKKLHRANGGTGQRSLSLISSLFSIIQNLITSIGFFIILFKIHWALSLGMVLIIINICISNFAIGKRRYHQRMAQTANSMKIGYLLNLLKGKEAVKELRVFGHEDYVIGKWENLYKEMKNDRIQLEKRVSILNAGISATSAFISIISTVFLVSLSRSIVLTMGQYVSLTQTILSSQGVMGTIANSISKIYEDTIYLLELYEFLDLEIDEKGYPLKEIDFPQKLSKGIFVKNLSFSYPSNTNEQILCNVTFNIKYGEKIAIVGENGAGKSTLLKCLLGLYDTKTGNIFYDDIDINTIKRNSLQKGISVIFQDFMKYNLSIKENIGIGDVEQIDNYETLRRAALKSDIFDLIERLENGWNTELSQSYVQGRELSGGQWQKIAIGRALFKDAQVLFFDEPTSTLDPIAETIIMEQFIKQTQNKTVIYISHRLGSCKFADRIFVLQKGRLVEQGDHNSLINQGGYYAQMYHEQIKWYEGDFKFSNIT